MAKFHYKFRSVEKVKESFEKIAQKELAEAEIAIERKQDEIHATRLMKLEAMSGFPDTAGRISVIFIRQSAKLVEYYDALIVTLEKELAELIKHRDLKQEELVQKMKERKIFGALKEKHKEEFFAEEGKTFQKDMDEIGLNLFRRGKT